MSDFIFVQQNVGFRRKSYRNLCRIFVNWVSLSLILIFTKKKQEETVIMQGMVLGSQTCYKFRTLCLDENRCALTHELSSTHSMSLASRFEVYLGVCAKRGPVHMAVHAVSQPTSLRNNLPAPHPNDSSSNAR